MKFTETEEYHKRLEICRSCPNYNDLFYMCKLCGCITVAKAKLETQKCPDNKW